MTYHHRHFARSEPAAPRDAGLEPLVREARRAPYLGHDEEADLARRWRDRQDMGAMDRLVRSHMRLVVKMASRYAGYGLPVQDLVSEGHVGLVEAIRRFEPERGFRLSTYATWWVDSMMKSFVISNWSLVRMGTTSDQKRMFFALRRMKAKLSALDDGDLPADVAEGLAEHFGVSAKDVIHMDRRLRGDSSLNAPRPGEGEGEVMDTLQDDSAPQDAVVAARDEADKRHDALMRAVTVLDRREKDIFERRRLSEDPLPLEVIARDYGVTRERIRQIEAKAFEKVSRALLDIAGARGLMAAH